MTLSSSQQSFGHCRRRNVFQRRGNLRSRLLRCCGQHCLCFWLSKDWKENLITVFKYVEGCSRAEGNNLFSVRTVNNTRSSGLKSQQGIISFACFSNRKLFLKQERLMKVITLVEVGWELAHDTCPWGQPELTLLGLLTQSWCHQWGRMKGRDSENHACRSKCDGHTRPDRVGRAWHLLQLCKEKNNKKNLGTTNTFSSQSLTTSHCSPCFPFALGEQWAPREQLEKGFDKALIC